MAEFTITTEQVQGLIRSACVLAGATAEEADAACRSWFAEHAPPLAIEYRPGRLDPRMPDGALVEAGVISPDYIAQYLADGGEAVSRLVGVYAQAVAPLDQTAH